MTCSKPSKNYYRSKSYSQTGSAAFCHSSSLPPSPYENKLFGSLPPVETDAVVSRHLKDWCRRASIDEGASVDGVVFEEKLGG